MIMERVFGVSVRIVDCLAGEVWHDSVLKLEVTERGGEMLGIVYLDLFTRRDKVHMPAHHVVQCGCRRLNQLPIVVLV